MLKIPITGHTFFMMRQDIYIFNNIFEIKTNGVFIFSP